MRNPLLDSKFLIELDKTNFKKIYAKIISLTQDELPIESIEGKVTKGTINIDGSSKVMRTCNLSLVTENTKINNVYWGLTNKFKLFLGVENTINSAYEDIIWFPQGIFVINSFKTSSAVKKSEISISGQDKICLLSGDISGSIPAATDFAYEEEILEDGSIQKKYLSIKHIIKEMVHHYGNEPFHNIVIKDVDDIGLEQLDYMGQDDLFIFRTEDGQYTNIVFDGDIIRYDKNTNSPVKIKDKNKIIYYSLAPDADNSAATWVKDSPDALSQAYQIVKCIPGEASGYRMIDLIWPEKDGLIAQAGDSVVSVLDKICKQFGEYEYFYDLDGHFVFQKKLTYINESWNNLITVENDESYVESEKLVSQHAYHFTTNNLIQSFNNQPDFKNLKNDFTIWGRKPGSSNSSESSSVNDQLAIHLRYAVHKKPESYVDYDGKLWQAGDRVQVVKDGRNGLSLKVYDNIVDWRELIYLMAKDYFAHNHEDDFMIKIARNNPQFIAGKTGYEQYYTDIINPAFWRELYDPYSTDSEKYFVKETDLVTLSNFGWNKNVFNNPNNLKFWFDFLDPEGGFLSKYSIPAIGSRGKVIKEDSIKAIIYKEIPSLIYITSEKYNEMLDKDLLLSGYTYVKIPESFQEYFQRSVHGQTAQQKLNDLLYQHLYINEKISIKTIPIYYLMPNTKITVVDNESGINGEYIINKINLNLGAKGMMSITASKAPARLY